MSYIIFEDVNLTFGKLLVSNYQYLQDNCGTSCIEQYLELVVSRIQIIE